jgi:hypothetical protein
MRITRTWTITDPSGHSTTCSQTVTVVDTVPPVLSGCVDVLTNALANTNGNYVTFAVTALDACDGAVPVICDPPSGSFFNLGRTDVRCVATDRCGNTNVCSFTVEVRGNCVEIVREEFHSTAVHGVLSYTFCVRNDSSHPLGHLTLVDLPSGVTATPYFITLTPPLPPGQTRCVTGLMER